MFMGDGICMPSPNIDEGHRNKSLKVLKYYSMALSMTPKMRARMVMAASVLK